MIIISVASLLVAVISLISAIRYVIFISAKRSLGDHILHNADQFRSRCTGPSIDGARSAVIRSERKEAFNIDFEERYIVSTRKRDRFDDIAKANIEQKQSRNESNYEDAILKWKNQNAHHASPTKH